MGGRKKWSNWNSFFFLPIVCYYLQLVLRVAWKLGCRRSGRGSTKTCRFENELFKEIQIYLYKFRSKSNSGLELLNVVSWFWALGGSLINGRKRIGEMNTSFSRQTFFYF